MKLLESYNTKQIESLKEKLEKKKVKITKILDESNKMSLDFKKLKEELAEKDMQLKHI